ncbi:MAG: nucleotide sugar dehydrogenase [Paeniclostridium sordellii]|nr:nucleotide sugar dehydrogenase [Paeniclostridium sordellii]
MIKKICVIGIGYIGLPTAAMFAKHGHDVVGVDINENTVNQLNQGNIVIDEPYLDELVKDLVERGSLKASKTPCISDAFIISVPTPINNEKKSDMKYVKDACESILPYIKKGDIVILESTSPIGTIEGLVKPILETSKLKIGEDIFLGYCPERVIPGNILKELKENDRLIGAINQISGEKIKNLYSSFVEGNIYLMDTKTAEICKLMENTYRDVNIALANELAIICDDLNINVWDVINFCNKHPRVNIHNPGPGVGGHCLAVDPWFIVEKSPQKSNLIKLSREINDYMPLYLFKKIEQILANIKQNKIVTILGMTYKADIDDTRESPIITLIDILAKNGYEVRVCDPKVDIHENLYEDLIKACENSELVLLAVNHKEFKNIDFDKIKSVMKIPIILDSRNFFNENEISQKGFKYYSI